MTDVDGTEFLAGFSSIHPLEKTIAQCLDTRFFIFFLTIDDTAAVDYVLKSCCHLCVPFYIWVLCLKNKSGSLKQRKSPYHFLHCEPLLFFSYFFLLSLSILTLGLLFHQVFVSKLLAFHSKEFTEVVLLKIQLSFRLRVTTLLKIVWTQYSTKIVNKLQARFFQTPFMLMAVTSCQAKSFFFF